MLFRKIKINSLCNKYKRHGMQQIYLFINPKVLSMFHALVALRFGKTEPIAATKALPSLLRVIGMSHRKGARTSAYTSHKVKTVKCDLERGQTLAGCIVPMTHHYDSSP